MEPGFVRELEQECEEVLNQVVEQHFDGLSPRIMHLMAKAAVTVLEAALESEDVEDEFVDEIDEEAQCLRKRPPAAAHGRQSPGHEP